MERFQIYLAGAVLHEPDEGKGWREKATTIFNDHIESDEYRVVTFDPTKYFSYSDRKDHETDKQIKEFYLDQIRHSRIVLVNLDRTAKSVGTGQELMFARMLNIPIIGFGKEDIYSWLKEDCQASYQSMLQAIDYIKEYYIERR